MNPYEMPLDFKIKKAVLALKEYAEFFGHQPALPGLEDTSGYQLCFSGGKDSCVIKALADMAGVKYTAIYSVTTIDPPELVRFIKKEHPDVIFNRPKKSFFHKLSEIGFPIRQNRWCCGVYKHNTGFAFCKILGIRAAESARRASKWKLLTRWNDGGAEKYCLCPILYWTEKDVWDFIKLYKIPYCSLYDEGFKRLGCIACPMASAKERRMQFDRWPRFEKLFRKAFAKLWKNKVGTINRYGKEWFGSRKFKNSDELFDWWISNESSPEDLADSEQCSMGLF